jgi:hypothetical protein
MIHYMRVLREHHERLAKNTPPPPTKIDELLTRVNSWWAAQSEPKTEYSFVEIKAAIGYCHDADLSEALIRAGWMKRRKWSTTGGNTRLWSLQVRSD